MARYTGSKDKLSRREGVDLYGKGANLTRLNVPPGFQPGKRIRKLSQYGQQLREKQKAKRLYGVFEKQFRRYVDKAIKSRQNSEKVLLGLLETRLDNVVYRLGFTPSRPSSRQLIVHGHVLVDGQRVISPSYQVKTGEVVQLSDKVRNIPGIKELLAVKKVSTPIWLQRKALSGLIKKVPDREDFQEPISVRDIVEFYSK
jgi:small subunit ribosomal protein S4